MTGPIQQNLPPQQPLEPANLLEYRATLPGAGTGVEATRDYFDIADRYGAALQAVHMAYRGGDQPTPEQQAEVTAAFGGLRTEVDNQTFDRLPEWLQEAVAQNGGNPL